MDEDDDSIDLFLEDPDIELIENYGVDIEDLMDDIDMRMNEMQFNVSNDEGSDTSSDNEAGFLGGGRMNIGLARRYGFGGGFGGGHDNGMGYNHASEPPRSNIEIFHGIESQVIKESPTMRLFIAAEKGQLADLQQALLEGAQPQHNSSSTFHNNILKARIKKIGLNKHQYQNVNDKVQGNCSTSAFATND